MKNAHQHWTDADKYRAIKMRRVRIDPQIIADEVGRSLASVRIMLSKTKIKFPPLRHGNLRYDKIAVARWREMERAGSSRKEIFEKEGVHTQTVSKKYAQELYGELVD